MAGINFTDEQEYAPKLSFKNNEVLADVSGSCSDDNPMTEIEYHEYMSKKAKTVHTITYPDGSKGELNRGVIVLL